jgi:hypothetical protein
MSLTAFSTALVTASLVSFLLRALPYVAGRWHIATPSSATSRALQYTAAAMIGGFISHDVFLPVASRGLSAGGAATGWRLAAVLTTFGVAAGWRRPAWGLALGALVFLTFQP